MMVQAFKSAVGHSIFGASVTGRRSEFEHENKLQCLTVKPFGVVLCCVCDLIIITV